MRNLSTSQLQYQKDGKSHSKTKLLEHKSPVVICEDLHGFTPGWSVGMEKSISTSLVVVTKHHTLFSQAKYQSTNLDHFGGFLRFCSSGKISGTYFLHTLGRYKRL